MKKTVIKMTAAVFALSMLLGMTCFAKEFDASFYAKTYPDVVNALGSDPTVLYNHYLTSGQSEGRLPYEGASKGEAVEAPSGYNDAAASQQPAGAGKYDLRNLTPIFAEYFDISRSPALPIYQNKINELINDPDAGINGNTTITKYKFAPLGEGHDWALDLKVGEIHIILIDWKPYGGRIMTWRPVSSDTIELFVISDLTIRGDWLRYDSTRPEHGLYNNKTVFIETFG